MRVAPPAHRWLSAQFFLSHWVTPCFFNSFTSKQRTVCHLDAMRHTVHYSKQILEKFIEKHVTFHHIHVVTKGEASA